MKKFNIITLALIGLIFGSCAKSLDVAPPNNIYAEQVQDLMLNGTDAQKEMIASALSATMATYLSYYDNGNLYSTGSAGPNTVYYQSTNDFQRMVTGDDIISGTAANKTSAASDYNWTKVNNQSSLNSDPYWFNAARPVAEANKLFRYMTEEAAAGSPLYADGRAKALIVRAYGYMQLMESFGTETLGMPLYDKYDLTQEIKKERATPAETYAFIINDLKEAVSCIKKAGKSYTNGTTIAGAEDFDLGLAYFLMARAALWNKDYDLCIEACNEIINSGTYSLIKPENYGTRNTGSLDLDGDGNITNVKFLPHENAFLNLAVNPEVIFGHKLGSGYLGQNSVMVSAFLNPFTAGSGVSRVNPSLYEKMDDNDVRKDIVETTAIGKYATATSAWDVPDYISYKFADNFGLQPNGTSYTDRELWKAGSFEFAKFRLAEVYLMKAEAQEMQTAGSGAATLKVLTDARALPGKTVAYTYNGMESIKLQWSIEMWGEGGREYYNKKRWGDDIVRSTHHWSNAGQTLQNSKLTNILPNNEIFYGCGIQNN
jgi:hypothetical protein